MKLSCTQENINKGLSIVTHLAIKNTNLLILNNVLIKAKTEGLFLSTTNLEIGINCKVRAKVEEEGEFTVPANLLTNFISLLDGDDVINIELINKELLIKTSKQQTKIKGEDTSEFPLIPVVEKENENIINSDDFRKALSQVVFAASLDEMRIEIAGVFMNFNKEEIILAATDSYRLAEKKVVSKNNKNNQQIIIPQKTAQEVLRILTITQDDEVVIFINDNQILFIINDIEITSRLIEGNYPDYTQIIPKEKNTEILIEKNKFIKTIKRAALFSKSGINDVALDFNVDEQKIIIKAVSSQTGENTSTQEAEIKGINNNIVFNYRYLLDGLANINSDKVIINIIDSASPGIFQEEKKESYLYIIMPIKQ